MKAIGIQRQQRMRMWFESLRNSSSGRPNIDNCDWLISKVYNFGEEEVNLPIRGSSILGGEQRNMRVPSASPQLRILTIPSQPPSPTPLQFEIFYLPFHPYLNIIQNKINTKWKSGVGVGSPHKASSIRTDKPKALPSNSWNGTHGLNQTPQGNVLDVSFQSSFKILIGGERNWRSENTSSDEVSVLCGGNE